MKWLLVASLALASLFSAPAGAQDWPSRTVRLIVPYPPGGNVDSAARIIGARLQAILGQPFVVENRAGAGGLVAGEYFKKTAADGYTFFVGANGPVLFAPTIAGREDAYNWRHDFVPITTVSMTPMVLEVNPKLPVNSLKDLFAMARKEPGKLTMASPGAGTSNHLLSEYIQSKLGLKWITVQYRGNAPATNDLMAGQVQFAFDQMSVALPFITSGKLRALAVTSPKRTTWLPDVPSFAELGYKDIDAQTFTGLFAPAGTPAGIVQKVHDAAAKALREPDLIEKFNKLGASATPMTPADFKTYLEHEDGKWMPIIRRLNIKVQ